MFPALLRLRPRLAAVAVLGLAFPLLVTRPWRAAAQGDTTAAKARVEAAKAVYQTLQVRYDQRIRPPGEEEFYWWSRRWFESERDAGRTREERVAAAQAHLDRMTRLESRATARAQASVSAANEAKVARYFRLEAESWLAQAKAE